MDWLVDGLTVLKREVKPRFRGMRVTILYRGFVLYNGGFIKVQQRTRKF